MFLYVVRSMIARLGSNLVTAIAIGMVVAGCLIEMAFANGLKETLEHTADPESVIVLSDSATNEPQSTVPVPAVRFIEALPEIDHTPDGQLLVSAELRTTLIAWISALKSRRPVALRGVDPIAYAVHHVEIVQGRAPAPGTNEVIVGRALVDTYPELGHVDESMLEGGRRVVGVFAARGAVFESEAWTDRGRMSTDIRVSDPNVVILRAKHAGDLPSIKAAITGNRSYTLRVAGERAFREAALNLKNIYEMVVLLIVVLSVVAIAITTTALHVSFTARTKEFAILAILGFPWRTVAGIILREAMMLSVAGVLLGWAASFALNGANATRLLDSEVAFSLQIGWRILLGGLVAGLAIGMVGALFPALLLRKMNVLEASR